jgi:hypothetical protein
MKVNGKRYLPGSPANWRLPDEPGIKLPRARDEEHWPGLEVESNEQQS